MDEKIMKEFRLSVWHGIHTGKVYLTQGQYLISIIRELELPDKKKEFMLKTLTELIRN